MKILVSIGKTAIGDTFLPPDVLAEISAAAAGDMIRNTQDREYTKDELRAALNGAFAVICGWGTPVFDAESLSEAAALRVIAYTGGSLDGVVTPEVFDRGIRVVGGNYAFGESVAEGALCYMLAALREIPRHAAVTRDGGWRRGNFHNRGLLGRTVGIIGYGASGRALAGLLAPFGVGLLVSDPYLNAAVLPAFARAASLDEICSECDIISLHAPALPATRHMLDARRFGLMKDGCVLVNTARGSLIDQEAMIAALSTRPIYAALDVTDPEPPAPDSPLRSLPNVMLIPHMAGPTVDRRVYITRILLADIVSIAQGKAPLNEISREYAISMSQG